MSNNLSGENEANELVTDLTNQLKEEVEKMLGMRFLLYKAIKYRTQTVRGKNFYVKMKVAGVPNPADSPLTEQQLIDLAASNNQPIKFIHVRFWRDLPVNNFKLTLYNKIETDKLETDPIDYFEWVLCEFWFA